MLELVTLGNRLVREITALCRAEGLSHAAFNALAVIEGSPEPLTAGEVARRMHVTTGTLTSILDTLVKQGYVERLVDPGDRRVVLVDVTPAAHEVLDRVLPAIQQVNKAIAGSLGDEVLASFLEVLAEMGARLETLPDDLPAARRRRPARIDRNRR